MITLLLLVLVFFIIWVIPMAHNRQMIKQAPQVSISAPYEAPEVATYNYSDKTEADSLRLIKRFGKLGEIAKQRTRVIERLRADSAELQHEADSLFVEVVEAKGMVGN